MKFFEVEIGTAEDPEAVITVRVTADTGQTMGLTCVRACGADMAGDLMAWTGSDETVRRRHTAWPSPPDRYRIEIRDPSAGAGETIVTAMAEDGSTASGSCQARHAYRMAVKLLQELRGEAGQDRAWDFDREVPPRPWDPAAGTALADRMGGGWPDDEPLPLDPDECVALVKGLAVRPRKPFDVQMLSQLPGKWEMMDGWIWFYRT
jgi:hypothetical protein